MCGIAGIVLNDSSVEKQDLLKMLSGIKHRGPDGMGVYVNKNIGLLHTRLSIIDVSEKANQPLYNEDKTIALICNGEIYNYRELRKRLLERGHKFSTDSDSEVIIHLFEEHKSAPAEMLNQLEGMFAFALYDMNENTLFIARDRFGIKPLYYARDSSGIYFASEITSLTDLRNRLKEKIDYTSLFEYLQHLSIPEPNTIYEGVKNLPAAHFAIIRDRSLKMEEWYSVAKISTNKFTGTFDEYTQEVSTLLEKVVKEHMIADVAVGSFLSAGIDSTLVTHYAHKNSKCRFSALTAAFSGEEEDESEVAKASASKMEIAHFAEQVKKDVIGSVEEVVHFMDQPLGISSPSSLYQISKKAKDHMKVVLTGDGGDEVFAGYDHKYRPFYLPPVVNHTPLFLRNTIGQLLNILPSKKVNGLSRTFLLSDAERFLNRNRAISEDDALKLIPDDKQKYLDLNRLTKGIKNIFEPMDGMLPLHKLLLCDVQSFLKSEMLYKVDRMTMANQIEARVPMLDHRVVELALSGRIEFLRDERGGKLPLRTLVESEFPGLGWRKKTGFNMPMDKVLQESGNWNQVVRLQGEAVKKNLLNQNEIDKMNKSYLEGNAILSPVVFSLMNLGAWSKRL